MELHAIWYPAKASGYSWRRYADSDEGTNLTNLWVAS
jgi:hypothetical protein